MQTFNPTPEIEILIENYKKEYHRTTGKEINVTVSRGWVCLNKTNYRVRELYKFLEVLKQRPTKIN